VWGLGLRVLSILTRARDKGNVTGGLGLRVWDSESRVQDFGFRV
jgi:hypothetical protein